MTTENFMNKHIDLLINRYPDLECIKQEIIDAYLILETCYESNHKLLIAGNGGSAADAEHIVGELMKSFKLKRPLSDSLKQKLINIDSEQGSSLAEGLQRGLPTIALSGHPALSTAYLNDVDGYSVFAQQVLGYGVSGDAFLGISTSGNSKNIVRAAIIAKALGMKIIGLTGAKNSKLSDLADVTIKVPEIETFKVQEFHLPIYHCLCLMLEEHFFGE